MGGAYIPPHMRKKNQSESKPENLPPRPQPSAGNLTVHDISKFFWPVKDDDTDEGNPYQGKTMHDSAATPHQLSYVLLFAGANPRWETDGIIFTKSSLDLLPSHLLQKPPGETPEPDEKTSSSEHSSNGHQAEETTETKTTESPIAVFKQLGSNSKTHGFKFEGWYKIDRLSILQPHSPELIRMLEQKWTVTDRYGNKYMGERDAGQWKHSLDLRWAVIKFVKDDRAQEERGVPDIERLPPQQRHSGKAKEPKKSVNELLAEMRLQATAPGQSEDG